MFNHAEFFRLAPSWKRWIYVLPLIFLVLALGENTIHYPLSHSITFGTTYLSAFLPLFLGTAAMIIWPSRASWWAITIAWCIFAWHFTWAWRLRFATDIPGKYEADLDWVKTLSSYLQALLIPLVIHFFLRPWTKSKCRGSKSA